MNYSEKSLEKHYEWQGKIEIKSRVPLETAEDLALAYTPGVAEACTAISRDKSLSFQLTRRWNTVAVITDGTAVLGLGNIGPEAGMPVMEGKCILFKEFGGVDAVPICIRSESADDIVNTIRLIAGSFGGINLEDISAPACFEVEKRLKECCEIPVFHDDQHGTAVVVLAALMNALRLTHRRIENICIVVNGAGAAGLAIAKLLVRGGAENIIVCDRKGIICKGREGLNKYKEDIAEITNQSGQTGNLAEALRGADVFIGVSSPNCLTEEMVRSMADSPIVFALANPVPEIMPDAAKNAGAAVVGTGRSDFPNQINNVLVFPGIFRGAFDVRAKEINDEMKIAAAQAIAELVTDEMLCADYIIPAASDRRVAPAVAKAAAEAYRAEKE